MRGAKILIVDADKETRRVIKLFLNYQGYDVDESGDGREALQMFDLNNYLLVLLDVSIPSIDGWTVCKKFREYSIIPIIILTDKNKEYQKLLGFELGADDYITKPFSPKEVVARIKAILKRTENMNKPEETFLTMDKIIINSFAREVILDGKKIILTPREYTLLYHFIKNKDRVFTRKELLDEVWGCDFNRDSRTVDTYIRHLREKLGKYKKCIRTVWGIGYKFDTPTFSRHI